MLERQVPLLVLLIAAAAARDGDDEKRDGLMSRISSGVTGAVVDIVDPERIVEQIDVNALMERVDINELLGRVDPQVLLDNVDVNALMDRVDVDALLDRVDVDALMSRVDVDALLDRVDIKELTDRAGIPDIVRESTGALAGSAMDTVRRQFVSVDQIVGRFTYKLIGRDPDTRPVAPPVLDGTADIDSGGRAQVTGHYAGPVSRLAAFMLDSLFVWFAFILFLFGVGFVLQYIFHVEVDTSWRQTFIGIALFVGWAFTYFLVGFGLAGRTAGMGVVGIGVVNRQGTTIPGSNALIRTLTFPLSFVIFGLGFLGIFTSPTRRSLHDAAAGTVVVYDWGERPAEMNAPITQWVNKHTMDGAAPSSAAGGSAGDTQPPADPSESSKG